MVDISGTFNGNDYIEAIEAMIEHASNSLSQEEFDHVLSMVYDIINNYSE